MKNKIALNVVKNKSITYMMPLIHSVSKIGFQQFLLNSYLSFEDGDNVFCILYKWSSNPDFLKYESELEKHPLYVGHADFGEHVVYKFNLTVSMEREKSLFIQGRYEEFSNHHKKCILEYMDFMGYKNGRRIKDIMTRGGKIKSTPPEVSNEVLMNSVKRMNIITDNFKDYK